MLTRTRRRAAGILTVTLVAISSWAVTAREQTALPSAADLVAKHVAAIGGEPAWRALTSMRATGTTELPAQGMRGTFEILAARPDRLLIRMDLAGLGKAESGYNGQIGWLIDPMVGPSLVTGGPLDEMKRDAQFDALLHPPSLVAEARTVERVTFDGRPAYKVAVRFVSGAPRDEFYDVETGLLLGSEGESDTPIGKVPSRIMLRDYRQFGAVRQPGRLVQASMGIEQHFIVESMTFDAVAASAFDPPAVIRALIKTPKTDEPWRVDALAAFDEAWSTIRDTYYDPAFGGRDWATVRSALRPKVESAVDPAAARAVIREMLATLGQSHFALLSASSDDGEPVPAGDAVVPIDTRLSGDAVVITSVEDAARGEGLTPGLVLLSIDGRGVDRWVAGTADLDARRRVWEVWRRVSRALQGADGSEVRLRVRDDRAEREVRVRRVRPSGERIVLGDLPPFHVRVSERPIETPKGRAVGVIGFNVWMASANGAIADAVDRHRRASGLVLDLRGNPGGLAAMIRGVAGHLFSEPVNLGRMVTRDSELVFPVNPRIVMADGRPVVPFSGPVAILVDELTASASECFAGGLQSVRRARVFGRATAGQVLPASTRRLTGGDLLMYVVGDFLTADGRRLEGVGVVPDEPVALDPVALRQGRDPDLEAALRWLDRQAG